MLVAAKTREDTESVTREHKVFNRYCGDLCVKEFTRDSTPLVQEKKRVDTRGKKRETTFPPGQLISRIVSRKK